MSQNSISVLGRVLLKGEIPPGGDEHCVTGHTTHAPRLSAKLHITSTNKAIRSLMLKQANYHLSALLSSLPQQIHLYDLVVRCIVPQRIPSRTGLPLLTHWHDPQQHRELLHQLLR